jgi:hypothetical protein
LLRIALRYGEVAQICQPIELPLRSQRVPFHSKNFHLNAGFTVQSVPRTHAVLDERSLALDAIVVGRLRENPALVDRAKEILARWQATSGPRLLPALLEWRRILE